ncbi:LacI family DNA-binding transcriptional regulator [Demequina phytophila]|uniref:LacI family DNA-binding transcriptional regulator n=1 Tax=Demequina phytophila TaxID=1638981 RepID=UPI0007817225|nr:LacI family DNA-binding transcriptional regulator [Demequina phytophila]
MTDAAPTGEITGRRRRSGAATIYDIAELAGVNPSTVSRALNQPGRVSAKTEEKIRKAAADLNFHANPMARALPTGRTHTLAVVVADITNPMVFGVIRGAERAASQAGFTLVIAESQESGSLEAGTIDNIAPSVDGIVLATSRLPDEEILRLAQRKTIVTLNREVDGIPSVISDPAPGVSALVAHLADLGHRAIAYLGGPSRSWISGRRWEALMHAARERGVAVFEIGPNSPTLTGGESAFERAHASGATAVVAYNDLMAIGLMRAAKAAGVSVPEDLSVVGFDDVLGDLLSPSLTSVHADLTGMGTRSVARLLAQLGADGSHEGDGPITTELVIRESTGPSPR